MGDMANHTNPPNATWGYDNKRKGYIFIANWNIEKGEEIFVSYGNKSK